MNADDRAKQSKILALLLIFCMLLTYKSAVWDRYFHPAAPKGAAPQSGQVLAAEKTAATGAAVTSTPEQPTANTALVATSAAAANLNAPTDEEIQSSGAVVVFTNRFQLKLSLLGGRLTEVLLNDYKDSQEPNSPALNLVKHAPGLPYPLGVYSEGLDDARVGYSVQSVSQDAASTVGNEQLYEVGAGAEFRLALVGALSDGRKVVKTLVFGGEGYQLQVNVEVQPVAGKQGAPELEWTKFTIPKEETMLDPYNASGYVWFDGEKAKRMTFAAMEVTEQALGKIQWLTLGEKYFMATLLSSGEGQTARILKSDVNLYRGRLAGEANGIAAKLFLGPKSYRLLKAEGQEMQRNMDFGKTGFIAAPLLSLLHFFFGVFGNYGLAIVALTILVKGLLYPLNAASFKSMKAMQDLQPDMKRIRETIKDKQQQQQELMALYKKRGVNPMGGCLPMFLQMPIFIGLWSALQLSIELRHAPYAFWIQDLSHKEALMIGSFGLPLMVLLMIASMLIQQWTTPSTMDPAQKRTMMIVPLVFGFMMMSLPAGLTLYMLTNNFISIGQQRAMQKHSSDKAALRVTTLVSLAVFAIAWIIARLGS